MKLDRRDFRLLLACCAIVLAGLAVLLAIAESAVPEGRIFSGFLVNNLDAWSYRAYANYYRYSRGLAIDNPWAVEPHPPAFINLTWLVIGRLMAIGVPFRVCWHAMQAIGSCLLLFSLLALIRRLTPRRDTAWTAFLLCAFGSGFGWLVAWIDPKFFLRQELLSIDLYQTDAFPALAYWNMPHQPLSWAMLAAICLLMHKTFSGEGRRWAVAAGVVALAMGFVRPYHFITILPVMTCWWLIIFLHRGRASLRYLLDLGILAGGMIPGLFYYGVLIRRAPNFAHVWLESSFNPRTPVLPFLLGFGIFIPLALFGLWKSRGKLRNMDERTSMVAGWLLVQILLVFGTPFTFSPHLIEGLLIPLSILAAGGFLEIRRRISARTGTPVLGDGNSDSRVPIPWAWIIALVVFVLPSTIFFARHQLRELQDNRLGPFTESPVSISRKSLEAIQFLDRQAGNAFPLVMSVMDVGIVLPALARVRAFISGINCVKDRDKKLDYTYFLYSRASTVSDWLWALESYPIDYVWWGPDEDLYGRPRPPDSPIMRRVFDNGEVTVYQVVRSAR